MTNVIELNTAPPDAGFLMDLYLRHQRAFRDTARDVRRAEAGITDEGWYASSLGSCYRQQYMQRLGIERLRGIDADALRTFAWGDHVEDFLRRIYQRLGLVESTQVRLSHGSLTARGDLLLRFPPQSVEDIPDDVKGEWSPEWLALLEAMRAEVLTMPYHGLVHDEIKSTHSRAMKFLFKEGTPRESHSIQVGCSILLESLVEDAARPDFHQIEYMGKDAVGILRFRVGDEWGDVALKRWRYLDAAWEAKADPMEVECECTDPKQKWKVTYCSYYDGGTGTCCGNAGLGQSQLAIEDPY